MRKIHPYNGLYINTLQGGIWRFWELSDSCLFSIILFRNIVYIKWVQRTIRNLEWGGVLGYSLETILWKLRSYIEDLVRLTYRVLFFLLWFSVSFRQFPSFWLTKNWPKMTKSIRFWEWKKSILFPIRICIYYKPWLEIQ